MPKSGPWTQTEDAALLALVEERSCERCPLQYRADCACQVFKKAGTWKDIASHLGSRTAGAAQGRYCGSLDPKVKVSEWTQQEDELLLRSFQDPEYNTWVKRALLLARDDPDPGRRRNGADVAGRYFALKKKQGRKAVPSTSTPKRARRTSQEEE